MYAVKLYSQGSHNATLKSNEREVCVAPKLAAWFGEDAVFVGSINAGF